MTRDRPPRRKLATIAAILFFVAWSTTTSETVAGPVHATLAVDNVASKAAKGMWRWTAYVAGPPEEIANIQCVIYTLHPTFPNPVRRICSTSDPKYPFGFSATGWGSFGLLARIEFKDGFVQEVVHPLSFSNAPL